MTFVYDFVVFFNAMQYMFLALSYASHLLIIAVGWLCWHGKLTLPHPPGFKAQSMAGKIPAV